MIIALLVSLAATVATGVIAYGELGKGRWQLTGQASSSKPLPRRMKVSEQFRKQAQRVKKA